MNAKYLNKIQNVNRVFSLIITALIFLPSFNFYLSNIFLIWGLSSLVVLIYGALLVLLFYGVYLGVKYSLIKKRAVNISVVLALMGIFSYLIYGDAIGGRLIRPDFHILYSELLFLMFFAIPALLVSSAVRDWDWVVDKLVKIAPFIVAMAFYTWYLVGFRTWGDGSINYMTLSYHVLTSGCICLAVSFTGIKPVYWIASIVFLFIIIGAGCRGALVCALLFIILWLIRQALIHKSSKQIIFISIILILTLPVLYAFFYKDISIVFDKMGISSRIIESLEDNEFLSSKSRGSIRNAIMEGISDNPFGYGLYGDRYITNLYYQGGAEYAHNIFFEFLADYGVFLGPLFFLLIIHLCYKIFKRYNETNVGYVLILLFPAGFAKLFFSSSYLLDLDFFIFVGFLLSCIVDRKKHLYN